MGLRERLPRQVSRETALGIANRSSAGIYSVRSPNQPKPSQVDERTLAASKAPPRKLRPRSEWFERQEKALETLLESEVRAVALSKLDRLVDQLAHIPQPRSTKDRHAESDFILKGILTSKQGGQRGAGGDLRQARTSGRDVDAVTRIPPTRDTAGAAGGHQGTGSQTTLATGGSQQGARSGFDALQTPR